MGQKFYNEADVQAIAAAIRAKNGTQNTYTVSQMPAAIAAITTGVPAETLVYAQRNAAAGAFVDEVTYDPADYSVSRIAAYRQAPRRHVFSPRKRQGDPARQRQMCRADGQRRKQYALQYHAEHHGRVRLFDTRRPHRRGRHAPTGRRPAHAQAE